LLFSYEYLFYYYSFLQVFHSYFQFNWPSGKSLLKYVCSAKLVSSIDTQMIGRNFRVMRVLGLLLDGKQRRTRAAKIRKNSFAETRKERLNGVMQQDPETGGPLGQGRNWVL
jgi:hypothetical protein